MRHRLLAWNSAGQMELLKDYHAMFCFGLHPPEPEKVSLWGQIYFRIVERTNKNIFTPIDSSAFTMLKWYHFKLLKKLIIDQYQYYNWPSQYHLRRVPTFVSFYSTYFFFFLIDFIVYFKSYINEMHFFSSPKLKSDIATEITRDLGASGS